MFGIGANELIIILIFGFIIFGPDKLPGMAKTVGQFIAKFRNAQAEMNKVIRTEVYDPNSEDPFKNPLDALSKIEKQTTKEDRGESFTERKARYDKQRAAKKAAEERKAEVEARKAAEKAAKDAALEAGEDADAASAAAKAAGEAAVAKVAEEKAAQAEAEAAKKRPTVEELYGTKPKAKEPKAKEPQVKGPQAGEPGIAEAGEGKSADGASSKTGSVQPASAKAAPDVPVQKTVEEVKSATSLASSGESLSTPSSEAPAAPSNTEPPAPSGGDTEAASADGKGE